MKQQKNVVYKSNILLSLSLLFFHASPFVTLPLQHCSTTLNMPTLSPPTHKNTLLPQSQNMPNYIEHTLPIALHHKQRLKQCNRKRTTHSSTYLSYGTKINQHLPACKLSFNTATSESTMNVLLIYIAISVSTKGNAHVKYVYPICFCAHLCQKD